MDVTKFIQEIAKREGLKEEVNIAQISEIVRVAKDILFEKGGFDLYELIKKLEEKCLKAVKNIIADQLGVKFEEVTLVASLVDLGMDELDGVELIMVLEEEFKIEIPDEDAEKLRTLGDFVKYIEEKT